jgi:RNase H-fold protein (predicted Holliday junction resolvase)
MNVRRLSSLHALKDLYKRLHRGRHGRKTLIGLDVGDKYIGVAVSKKSLTSSIPLITIHRYVHINHRIIPKKITGIADEFRDLIRHHNTIGFVVGLPLYNNQLSRQAMKVQKFMTDLSIHGGININIYYQDETLSTDHAKVSLYNKMNKDTEDDIINPQSSYNPKSNKYDKGKKLRSRKVSKRMSKMNRLSKDLIDQYSAVQILDDFLLDLNTNIKE